jgi:hypothetical protein
MIWASTTVAKPHGPRRVAIDETEPEVHGRSEEQWEELVGTCERWLKDVASRGRVTTYTETNAVLARRTGQPPFNFESEHDRAAMGELLGTVVDATLDEDGVMLSALVHYLNHNDAGPGFYTLAALRGLLPAGASADERLVFWTSQVDACHRKYR